MICFGRPEGQLRAGGGAKTTERDRDTETQREGGRDGETGTETKRKKGEWWTRQEEKGIERERERLSSSPSFLPWLL